MDKCKNHTEYVKQEKATPVLVLFYKLFIIYYLPQNVCRRFGFFGWNLHDHLGFWWHLVCSFM